MHRLAVPTVTALGTAAWFCGLGLLIAEQGHTESLLVGLAFGLSLAAVTLAGVVALSQANRSRALAWATTPSALMLISFAGFLAWLGYSCYGLSQGC